MKLLLAILFCFLFYPSTADAYDIIWGTSSFRQPYDIICTTPSTKPSIRDTIIERINKFDNVYNRSFIDQYLKNIYVCKDLIVDDMEWYRGTYLVNQKAIFIEVDDASYNDTEFVLHHELSSIVFFRFFSEPQQKEWKRNNNFVYQWYVINNDEPDWIPEERLQKNGALFRYSTTDFENDFNVMAGYYLTPALRSVLDGASEKYDRIKNKKEIIEKIYKDFIK